MGTPARRPMTARATAMLRRAAAALDGFAFEPREPAEATFEPTRGARPPVVVATGIGSTGCAASVAAAVGVAAAAAGGGRATVLVDLDPPARGRGPTLLASDSARRLEDRIRALGGPFGRAAARGSLCYVPVAGDDDPLGCVAELLEHELPAAAVIVHLPQALWPQAVADARVRPRAALMHADLPADRALAALAARELHARGLRAKVVGRPLGRVGSRRALGGIDPGGAASGRAARLARALLERPTDGGEGRRVECLGTSPRGKQ